MLFLWFIYKPQIMANWLTKCFEWMVDAWSMSGTLKRLMESDWWMSKCAFIASIIVKNMGFKIVSAKINRSWALSAASSLESPTGSPSFDVNELRNDTSPLLAGVATDEHTVPISPPSKSIKIWICFVWWHKGWSVSLPRRVIAAPRIDHFSFDCQ